MASGWRKDVTYLLTHLANLFLQKLTGKQHPFRKRVKKKTIYKKILDTHNKTFNIKLEVNRQKK